MAVETLKEGNEGNASYFHHYEPWVITQAVDGHIGTKLFFERRSNNCQVRLNISVHYLS
jgi:hypothetical protein